MPKPKRQHRFWQGDWCQILTTYLFNGYKLNEIAKESGSVTYSNVSITMQRAKKLNDFHRHLKRLKKMFLNRK